ncbi:hypothetical protein AJ80_07285 [Polytolypa hystricis UAMH7299]|uniref:G-patch domain-containing protein n=1 Tax=Polytolypa hystricis (strain UAMH7299) TaxID=1447883 RepID=A0A2B7XRG9_POLH7|nr:hypothetical protein AJ80_07285 [Polytolypa hystricis UAMH7299]
MSAKRSRAAFEDGHGESQHAPYAVYGTPLPPAESGARDDGSFVPIWKQEVTDERGRKRLHGAFTGGFSAGYFNTVGSKEGWTPSTFVSSRKDRAKDKKQASQRQRLEDFMDEEDIREAEESREVQMAADYAGFGSTATDSTRLGGLVDVFRVSGETMGVKLLKKMGWKEGQGIGPKVRRKAHLGAGDSSGAETHLFAPENAAMISFIRKSDSKGLGFEGGGRLGLDKNGGTEQEDSSDVFGARRPIKSTTRQDSGSPKLGGGFGVGILNDTGSDDEDPYQMGPRISYNRVIGGDKKTKRTNRMDVARPGTKLSNPLLSSKPVFISKKRAAAEKTKEGFRKCHDGRLPLDGFLHGVDISALTISSQEKRYAPPEIPKDWKSTKAPSVKETGSGAYMSAADAARASTLDPTTRAALLGEEQLPGKSIFDYMTPEARERIVKATGRTNLPPARSEKAPKGYEVSEAEKRKDLWGMVPRLDKNVAKQALARGVSGWMPYAEDENKRSRYRAFLELRAGLSDTLPERVPKVTTEEWATELHEFARAAEVFKPISGMMASRFTSSSHSASTPTDPTNADHLLRKPAEKPEDPAEAAARMGMYGPMTRSSKPFDPHRLLCKRFNVRPPANVTLDPGEYPGGEAAESSRTTDTTTSARLDLVSKDVMNQLMMESAANGGKAFTPTTGGAEQHQVVPAEVKKIEVNPDKNEAIEAERPGAEVFKAIFGSDDEDED